MTGNETTLKDRLLELADYKGISPNKLSVELGLSRSYLQKINNNITTKVLLSLLELYPDLNITWLLTGTGAMFLDLQPTNNNNSDMTNIIVDQARLISELRSKISYLVSFIEEKGFKISSDIKEEPEHNQS